MSESSRKIRELTEAMRAEKDVRIRNRMMAVMGVLKGHSTKTASDFADVDRRTVQLWVVRFNEGGIGGLRDAPGRGRASRARYGRIRRACRQACRQEHAHPEKASKLDTGKAVHPVQPVQRAQDTALPRVFLQEIHHQVRLGGRRGRDKEMAGRCRRHDIGGKKARIYHRGAGRVDIRQGGDEREEIMVARRRSGGRHQIWQEGQDRRVRAPWPKTGPGSCGSTKNSTARRS